jgi:hypothetical protein
MLSRSILTYTLFRGTRTLSKSGFDSIEEMITQSKPCMCDQCGEIWGGNPSECYDCGSKDLRKLYKDYERSESIIDKDLSMVNVAA